MYWLTSIQPHPFAVLPYILKEVAQTVEGKRALGELKFLTCFRFHIRGPLLQMFSGKFFSPKPRRLRKEQPMDKNGKVVVDISLTRSGRT